MEAQRTIEHVDSNGQLHIDLDQYRDMDVEVIIVPVKLDVHEGESKTELQMQSGFVKELLLDPAEDVWNEL
ncbi:MAG: hypothetical protein HOE44_07080 [Candidatus Marinimicrobia bacterium]|jgi:hypothetical protein|nr:hypothetical protein [Candidatus Neomarinimicrobiota bacterium]